MSDPRRIGDTAPARYFVFMGVCGVGKSTVGRAVADLLSGSFVEADTLHPAENVRAMAAGRPLSDEERWPWLEAVCDAARFKRPPVMIACSALKADYRGLIRSRLPDVVFLHLEGPRALVRERMLRRTAHFMPAALLDSQLAILEPPRGEARTHTLDIRGEQDEVVANAAAICRRYCAAQPQDAEGGVDENRV